MNDEPNAAGLSFDEVIEIQKHLADVPAHLIPSAIQKIEMKLDRKLLEERKDIECQQKKKLDDMRPKVKYPYRLPCKSICNLTRVVVNKGDKYDVKYGEKSNESATQQLREADKFAYYERGNPNRMNPTRELDEFYCKDDRIMCIDLQGYADEHIKEMEDKLFNEEMEQLQPELEKLEEGKCNNQTRKPTDSDSSSDLLTLIDLTSGPLIKTAGLTG